MDYNKIFTLEPIKYFCEFDLIWKTEEWKDIAGYENKYQVSDLGRVKSLNFNRENISKILKTNNASFGYKNICLSLNNFRKTYAVHVLVAIAFLGHKPNGYHLVINHKNFIKTDNRKLNLEIVTQRENANLLHIKSTSEFVGVSWSFFHKKWLSKIVFNKKRLHLGYFDEEKEANEYYKNALISIQNGTEIIVKKSIYSSNYKGVSWSLSSNKWRSYILINGRQKHLGLFINEIDAHNAYQNALKDLEKK